MMNSKLLAQSLAKLATKKNADKAVNEFFTFLKEKNLMNLLPNIKMHLDRELAKKTSQDKLIISSKHELTDADIERIIALVGAEKDVEKEIIENESLVGGFSAIYRGNIYDGSLRNQITQLKNQLTR